MSCSTATTRCAAARCPASPRPLRAMGAQVFTAPGGTPPRRRERRRAPARGVEHRLTVASAQVKSCLLLAGLYAEGTTWVHEPAPSRDHTERMLEAAGVRSCARAAPSACAARWTASRCPTWRCRATSPRRRPTSWPGRCSATRRCGCQGVNLNPRRTGLLAVMRRMGADVREEAGPDVAGRAQRHPRRGARRVAAGDRGRPRGGAVDDRRAAARGAARGDGDGHDRRARRGRAARQGERPDRRRSWRRCGPWACDAEEREDGFAVHGDGRRCGADDVARPATTAWRCSARSPGLASLRRGRGGGLRGGRGLVPGLRARPRRASGRCPRDRGDRRARRRRQEHGRAGGRPPARRRLSRHGRDVPGAHLARAASAASRRRTARPSRRSRASTRWRSSRPTTATASASPAAT